MKKRYLLLRLVLICLFCLAGMACSRPGVMPAVPWFGNTNLVQVSYIVADELLVNLKQPLSRDKVILVGSFLDINNLEQSSAFGRVLGEQVTSRLAQQGYAVSEVKLRENLIVRQGQGELLLSRKIMDISGNHNAQAVIVGTYARGKEEIYVTARLVQADNGRVLSAYDFQLPLDRNIKSMLKK